MKTKLTGGWLVLGLALLAGVPMSAWASACTCARFNDWKDLGCKPLFSSAGTPAKSGCPPCNGMPRWWVSEPYINLCLKDTPLSYRMSSGKATEFSFYYRQRAKLPETDEVSALPTFSTYDIYPTVVNCGTNASWGNNWGLSLTIWDPVWESSWRSGGSSKSPPTFAPYSQGYQVFVWRPEGGINYFSVLNGQRNIYDPQSLMRLTSVVSGQNYPVVEARILLNQVTNPPIADANGVYWGNPGVGLSLIYPDGSQDVFGLTPFAITDYPIALYASTAGSSESRLLLTQRIDPQGRVTRLGYDHVTNTSPYGVYYYRLHYVVDPDGLTNTFLYNTGLQVSEIDDPYGRKTQVAYTTLYGSMAAPASITDAAGLSSTFSYQGQTANGWLTSLSTPYGTTRFNYYAVTDSSVTDGYAQRAIYVSEPEGAQQLYLYQHQNPGFVPASETSPTVPGQTDFDDGTTGGTSGHGAMTYRNTFHWGRRQYEALSGNASFIINMSQSLAYQFSNPSVSQGDFASALSSLGASDYNRAGEKHWLMSSSDQVSITEGLSSERDPCPDLAGATPGLRTWYNYPGKPSPELLGDDPKTACIARVLPDGSSQYTTYHYYGIGAQPGVPAGAGFVSDNESSYSKADGSIGALTNWFGYAANSVDLISLSNSTGQYVNAGYNGSHQITSITNALGQLTSLSWDPDTHNLTGLSQPGGQTVGLGYAGLLNQVTLQPQGRTIYITSFAAGLPQGIHATGTGLPELWLTNFWDGLNRLTGTAFADGTTVSNAYDRLDLAATKDRLGHWSYYGHDGLEHLTTVTDARSNLTLLSWCDCGSLAAITDALTNTTTLHYNNQGLLTNVTFADTSSLNYGWDLAGRLVNASDGGGRSLTASYNNQGLLTSLSNAVGSLSSVLYDTANRPVQVTDANGVTLTNTFDAINQLLARTWPDGLGESFGWATNGLAAYTNRDRQVTRYTRDGAGRLLGLTNANLEVVGLAYNALDEVSDLWDGRASHTGWSYNEFGWLLSKSDGLGRTVFVNTCDPNGQVTNRWTPQFGDTRYAYDPVGNVQTVSYPVPPSTVSYFYDALNRLTNMVDAAGSTTFAYTPAGKLQGEDGPWANDAVTYGYSQQLRQTLNLAQPSGTWQQNYGHDSAWRLQSLSSPAGSFAYSYDPLRFLLPGLVTLPNFASVTNHYDSLSRLDYTALANHWGRVLDGYGYGYDPLGLRTNISRDFGFAASAVSVGYDGIGQLTSWSASEPGNGLRLNEQFGFGYDPAHNLMSRTNGALVQTFVCDPANELTNVTRTGAFTLIGATPGPVNSVTVNGLAAQTNADFTFASPGQTLADGPNTFTVVAQSISGQRVTNNLSFNLPQSTVLRFDLNGNLTNNGALAMFFNAENRLTNITAQGAWKSEFVYDGLGRRRIERDYGWQGAWAPTNELHSVYDGWLLLQVRDSNNVPLVTYTHGLDLGGGLQSAGGIGGLVARTDGSGSTFYHADGAGNITGLIDGNQNMAARHLYSPFGRPLGQWGPLAGPNAMQFSSMMVHHPSGMSMYLFRDGYDPSIQRWIQRDPIGETGGLNVYGFVGNNPINGVDPYGLDSLVPGNNGTQENSLPALTVTQPVNGGLVSTRYPGPDSLLLLGGMGMAGMGLAGLGPQGMLVASASILDRLTPPLAPTGTQIGVMPAWLGGPNKFGIKPCKGGFKITNWEGYPNDLPKPDGPFNLLEGAEYDQARKAADAANRAIHQADASLAGQQIHEIQPVKFGGSPTDPANKIPLTPQQHAPATTWWNRVRDYITGD